MKSFVLFFHAGKSEEKGIHVGVEKKRGWDWQVREQAWECGNTAFALAGTMHIFRKGQNEREKKEKRFQI